MAFVPNQNGRKRPRTQRDRERDREREKIHDQMAHVKKKATSSMLSASKQASQQQLHQLQTCCIH